MHLLTSAKSRLFAILLTILATAVLAVLLMCWGGVKPAYAFTLNSESGDAADNGGITWSMTDGNLLVNVPEESSYEGDDTLVIPEKMQNQTVIRVKNNGSSANAAIKKIVYPKSIKDMNHTAYRSLPLAVGAVEEISFHGEGDFALESIGKLQWHGAKPIFPSTLKKFNADEEYDFVVPSSVTTLGYKACQNIAIGSLYIPKSLTTAHDAAQAAFKGCSSLEKVTNDSDIWIAFPDCPNIEICENRGTVTEISRSACQGWEKLTTVTIPSPITAIGGYAFADCTSLTEVIWDGQNVVKIGTNAFNGTTSLKTLPIPDTVRDIGAGAFAESAIETLRLPASLFLDYDSGYFSDEFLYGDSTVAVTAPLFIPGDGKGTLTGTNSVIKDIDLSAYQQTFLPSYMMAGCTALEAIAIPRTVNTIMGGVFYNCTALNDVYYYGDPAVLNIAETQKKTHPLGYKYVGIGSFSVTDENSELGYANMQGLTFYGLAAVENNALRAFADANNGTFVPYAFLGDGGSSADVQEKFGTTYPSGYNTVSITSFTAGGTPVIEVAYPYDEGVSRTLVPGKDCTVVYTDASGAEVTSFDKGGTYTATITGDNKSVWGTTTATFTVAPAPTVQIPVADAGNTGITANGSLVAPEGSEALLVVDVVTSGEAYDTLMAQLGDGVLAGVYSASLLVDGQEVHDGFGLIALTFPVDPQYNGRSVTVYHLHADGSITSETVLAADGAVTVTVTDLSNFMLEVDNAVPVAGGDDTGDNNGTAQQVPSEAGGTAGAAQKVAALGSGSALPATGDETPVVPFAAFAGAALAALGAYALARRSSTREK